MLRVPFTPNATRTSLCAVALLTLTWLAAARMETVPVADAGSDQTPFVGATVTLDGRGSTPAGVTYAWSFQSRAKGSAAVLSGATGPTPSFVVDKAGAYVVKLVVSTGGVSSAADTVTVTTVNRPPVANAGLDVAVGVGKKAAPDGSGSSDPDGDKLTYAWTLLSMPAAARGTVDKADKSKASVVLDRPGTYLAELTVSDGVLSASDTVTLTTVNATPKANAGPDQVVTVGQAAHLDGAGSSDVDEDDLSFAWTVKSAAKGSVAAIVGATSVRPSFTPDVAGNYTLQLAVSDGVLSKTDTVVLTTNNVKPVAAAGPDQRPVTVGTPVRLDGSGASDVDGQPLTSAWTLKVPTGSAATLSDPTAVRPIFTPDIEGAYSAKLTVSDGDASSAADTVKFVTKNVLPVAQAGPDQLVAAGATVPLDGSGSTDLDGQRLTYGWAWLTRPPGSAAAFSSVAAIRPTFTADVPGTYVAQLIVFDGLNLSAADTVAVTTEALGPVARAGADRATTVGATVTLDGSGSADPAGGTLTYAWTLVSRPATSTAALTAATTPTPAFVADKAGDYVAQLIVTDGAGRRSRPDTVLVSTGNLAPRAHAGADQVVAAGATVTLSGAGTVDPNGGTPGYAWALIAWPAGSAAALTSATTVGTSFVADVPGEYVAQLLARDASLGSAPDTVHIRAVAGGTPVAHAGPDQARAVGTLVTLDGSASSDPDGDLLTYAWSFVSVPAGSTATLAGATTVAPTFTPNVAGSYVVQLIVNDGTASSAPDTVTITATTTTLGSISLSTVGGTLVGVGQSATLRVTLSTPAPTGGRVVTVTSGSPAILAVASPGTVSIAAGATEGTIALNGLTAGSALVRGNASGYTEGTLSVTVTNNVISMPSTLNVAFGQTMALSVTLTNPAPAGGVTVSLSSSDPATIEVVTPTVSFPAGQTLGSGTIRGKRPGIATVTGTATGWVSDNTLVNSNANLNITESTVTFNAGFPRSITIQLESGGAAIAAPPGGVSVTLTSSNGACVTAVSPRTIGAGLVTTTSALSYGGTATLPCTATLTAGGTDITGDTVSVTVNPAPPITLFTPTPRIAKGTQSGTYTARLGTATHAGVTLRIESSNPAAFLVSTSNTVAGAAFIEVPVAVGSTDVNYWLQSPVSATIGATATITASAPGFTTATGTASVGKPTTLLYSVPASISALSANAPFGAYVGVTNAADTALETYMYGLPGNLTVVTFTNSNPAVGKLVTLAGSADTRTVVLPPTSYYTAGSVATGGVEFDPTAGGTTTVTASAPSSVALSGSSQSVMVTAPAVTLNTPNPRIAKGMQSGSFNARLGGSAHGGVTMRVESSNPAAVLVSTSNTVAGAAFIEVPVAAGSTDVNYWLQSPVGATIGATATITASAPGFTSATGTATVGKPTTLLYSVPASISALSANAAFGAYIGVTNAAETALETYMYGLPGNLTVVTFTNSNAAVAKLVTLAGSADTRTVVVPHTSYYTPGAVSSGGVEFDPIAGGTTTVASSTPGSVALAISSQAVTVTAPAITLTTPNPRVAKGTQLGTFAARLGGSAHGGVTMRIESSNPAAFLVSTSNTVAGAAFIEVPVAAGSTDVNYWLQSPVGATIGATATITASAPGFTTATGTATVGKPTTVLYSLPASLSSVSANTAFGAYIGVTNAADTGLETYMYGLPGNQTVVTFTNSNAAVAKLVTLAGSADTRTAVVPPSQYYTPGSVASGGVEFDPTAGGTTTVTTSAPGSVAVSGSSQAVTVTAPAITMVSLPTKVGAGLQSGTYYARLNGAVHGGVTVRIESSNPAVALVAPNNTTAGAAFIDVNVPNGLIDAPFWIQGVPGAAGNTVTITASTTGFTSGFGSASIVTATATIESLPASIAAGAASQPFYVYVGIPNASLTAIEAYQYGLPGGGTVVTVQNGTASVAQLVTLAGAAQSRTIVIPPSQYYSYYGAAAGGVDFDPLAAGTTTVTSSATGWVAVPASSRVVTVTP
jgi:hypothetical protein